MKKNIFYFKNSFISLLLLLGFVWLGVGILHFFEENIICQILTIILFIFGLIGSLILTKFDKEKVDEMTRHHLTKAYSSSFIYVIVFITLLTLASFILDLFHINFDLRFSTVAPFIYAIGLLGISYKYIYLEKHGE